MRHGRAGKKFARTTAHRKAMFSNMVASLVMYGRIETTDTKAKVIKRIADRTISWGTSVSELVAKGRDKQSAAEKAKIVHAMRMAGRVIRSSEALEKLFGDVAPRFKGRAGGYTRVLKTRFRVGDAVSMSFVELVVGDKKAEPAPSPTPDKAEGTPAEKKAKAPKAEKVPKAPRKAKAT